MQIAGLILDIIGAILLFISTEMMNKMILGMVSYLTGSHKRIGENKVIAIIKRNRKAADQLSKLGIGLLILGFIFQLIGALYFQ